MFSSRQVDWKRGTTAIACYYSMESLPKDMRGKVELDPATDSAMLYSSKTTIWPKNKELDLGKSSTRKEYSSVLFWRTGPLEIQVPVNYRPSPTSAVLRGSMKMELKVDGDLGASKLVEGFFTSKPGVSELDSGSLSSFVKDTIRGRVGTMLEGLEESNLRDPTSRQAANDQAQEQLNSILNDTGILVDGLNISWKKTGGEKLGQKRATLDRRRDVMDAKIEEDALERMKKSGNMDQLEKHRAETIASEFLEEDRTRRDTARLRRKAEVRRLSEKWSSERQSTRAGQNWPMRVG